MKLIFIQNNRKFMFVVTKNFLIKTRKYIFLKEKFFKESIFDRRENYYFNCNLSCMNCGIFFIANEASIKKNFLFHLQRIGKK